VCEELDGWLKLSGHEEKQKLRNRVFNGAIVDYRLRMAIKNLRDAMRDYSEAILEGVLRRA
jgi:hypothetical protein